MLIEIDAPIYVFSEPSINCRVRSRLHTINMDDREDEVILNIEPTRQYPCDKSTVYRPYEEKDIDYMINDGQILYLDRPVVYGPQALEITLN